VRDEHADHLIHFMHDLPIHLLDHLHLNAGPAELLSRKKNAGCVRP
jgi:hypothetical protein